VRADPYRDLDVIDRELSAARDGRFSIEPLLFHLAGIPSYLVLAELSVKRVLRGQLPTPEYPAALRQRAREVWWGRADVTFGYARDYPARGGRVTQCVGLVAQAASQGAHAVLAARGEWITNEKALLDRAGFRRADEVLGGLTADPPSLVAAVDAASDLIGEAAG